MDKCSKDELKEEPNDISGATKTSMKEEIRKYFNKAQYGCKFVFRKLGSLVCALILLSFYILGGMII